MSNTGGFGTLLAANYDLTVVAFNTGTGEVVGEFEIGTSQGNCIHILDNKSRFAVGAYSYLYIYDFGSRSRTPIQSLLGHEGNVTGCCSNGSFLYTCGEDKSIKVWDLRTCEIIQSIDVDAQLNRVIDISDRTLVACTENGYIYSYDIDTGDRRCVISPELGPIRSLAASKIANKVIAACHDGTVVCYDVNGDVLDERYRVKAHNSTALQVNIAPNNSLFATTSSDGSARIWTLDEGEQKQNLATNNTGDWVWDAVFSGESDIVFTGGSDCCCRAWEASNGRVMAQYGPMNKCISALGYVEY